MSKILTDIDKFHKTRRGKLAFGVAELLLAYLFVSLAINSGSLWQYAAAILLFIGGLNNLVRFAFNPKVKSNVKTRSKNR